VGKLPGMSSVEIQALAVLGALKDAGYRLSELDGVINLNPYQSPACSRRLSQSILASSRASARVRTRKKVDLTVGGNRLYCSALTGALSFSRSHTARASIGSCTVALRSREVFGQAISDLTPISLRRWPMGSR